MQSRQRDETRIDFEEFAQGRTSFAAAKSVRTERSQSPWHPLADHVWQRLQIIGSGNQYSGSIGKQLGHVGNAGLVAGVQTVPALGLISIDVEFLVARYAPNI